MQGSTEEDTSEREKHSGKASQKYCSSIIPYPKPLRPNIFWYSEFLGYSKVIQYITIYLTLQQGLWQYHGIKHINISAVKHIRSHSDELSENYKKPQVKFQHQMSLCKIYEKLLGL